MLRGLLLWLAGADLRVTLLAIPPVIPLIHRDLGLDESGIAALSNLPVLVLALSSVFGALLTARFGARRALIGGLWLIAVSSALRGAGPSLPMLFAMTLVMGVGIALIQPAFPALARAWFPHRITLGTGLWANGLLCGEAISASLTIPLMLPLAGGSWERSLAGWSIPVALTALALGAYRGVEPPPLPVARWFPNFRDARVWQIGILQSAASVTYFGANTFLPDYLHAAGRSASIAACLTALNAGQLPASLAAGLIPMRLLAAPAASWLVAALLIGALGLFLSAGGAATIVASAVFGLCAAYILTLSFAAPALLADPHDVATISAGAFTLGYAIAFLATLASGKLWDLTHQPAAGFLPIAVAAGLVVVLGPRVVAGARAA